VTMVVTCCAQALRSVATQRNPKRKRELIKKVIAYMTLGIDVSRLYSEMVLVRRCFVPGL